MIKFAKYSALIILVITACKKEIPFELEGTNQKIVVNAILSPDSSITVLLSNSISVVMPNDELLPINNAIVELSIPSNQQTLTIPQISEGIYSLKGLKPTNNTQYNLKVSYNNQTIYSTTSVPFNNEVISIKPQVEYKYDYFNKKKYPNQHFYYTITDNVATEDYYSISVFCYQMQYFTGSEINDKGYPVIIDSANLYVPNFIDVTSPAAEFAKGSWYSEKNGDSESMSLNGYEIYFSDNLFNGKSHTLNILNNFSPVNVYSREINDYNKLVVYYLILKKHNKEHYQYQKSLSLSTNSDNFLAEKVQIYTNIQNGFGIFSAYTPKIDSVLVNLQLFASEK